MKLSKNVINTYLLFSLKMKGISILKFERFKENYIVINLIEIICGFDLSNQ